MNYEGGLTLGELIARLEALETRDSQAILTPGMGGADSYRGYYVCVAFEPQISTTVQQALAYARDALNNTYEGYKGGFFDMTLDTECYIAQYGITGDCLTEERFNAMLPPPEKNVIRMQKKDVRVLHCPRCDAHLFLGAIDDAGP